MKKTSKMPPQSPECVRDAAIVLAVHPTAEAYYVRKSAKVCIETGEEQLGIGGTAEAAWADAVRTVNRKPIPPLPPMGSPTMSLRSDEVFWKGKRNAEAVS